jgi:hypothetical protein
MRPVAKLGIVAAGYAAAFAIARAALARYVAATSGPDRQTYGAMFAFGDDLYFLAVFGAAALPAACATLYFLRPCRRFWSALSIGAAAWATTALAAAASSVAAHSAGTRAFLGFWSAAAHLRILAAPVCAPLLLLCGLFAPERSFRLRLFVAASVEAAVFVAFLWLQPSRTV